MLTSQEINRHKYYASINGKKKWFPNMAFHICVIVFEHLFSQTRNASNSISKHTMITLPTLHDKSFYAEKRGVRKNRTHFKIDLKFQHPYVHP